MPCRSAAPSALSPPTGPRSARDPTIIGTETYALFLRHGSLATHEDVNRFLALERAVQQERYPFHLIEQPMLGCCCCGAVPVWATCSIASNNSRRAFGAGLEGVAASIRPRYCRRRLA